MKDPRFNTYEQKRTALDATALHINLSSIFCLARESLLRSCSYSLERFPVNKSSPETQIPPLYRNFKKLASQTRNLLLQSIAVYL